MHISLLSHLSSETRSLNSSVSAKIRMTGTMTAEGVTVMEPGTLPYSVLAHYSIISQWSPHKSELCATRGDVPYGTSDPEKQRVAKDPQSPTSQLLQGPPSPSLIDFNNRLQGAECSHSLGWWGFSQVPQRTLQHLELFVWIASCVCGSQTGSVTQSDTYSMYRPFTHPLKHLFIYQLNNFFTQSLAYSFMHSFIHSSWCTYQGRACFKAGFRGTWSACHGRSRYLRVRHLLHHMCGGIWWVKTFAETIYHTFFF